MVRFRILGTLEIWTGQEWVGIGAPKWRSLLATLLINADQVVSTDRLVMELWADDPPASAINLVSIYALQVRKLMGDADGKVLRRRAPGYQLRLDAGDLDAARFEALVAEARRALAAKSPQRGADLLAEALGLWRGGALLDVAQSPRVVAEVERLGESRLNALELKIEADIGCGRHAEVTPELSRLIADQPLREGLHRLLMLALVGAGRRAEALTAYERARHVIRDELGVAPGEQLQRLYQQILTSDSPSRSAPATAARNGDRPARGTAGPADGTPGRGGERDPAGPGIPAQAPSGEPETAGQEPPAPAPGPPMQLPADITDFTGRTRDLERLCDLQPAATEEDNPGAVMVSLVTGAGGLGKTTLSVHAAHRMRDRFPDGQLYVNLLGASPQPLTPSDVLARFLRELGVRPAQIPVDEDERAALYRTRLTGRRVLIVLDDARDAAQVRPLLPGSASCAVLVSARNRLSDLAVSRLIDLDVLDDDEARALFAGIVGAGRAGTDPAATDEVLAACAGLPLAIRIAGARLAARTGWSVRTLANKLRSQQRRLDELKAGDLAVRATFEVSFASLPGPVTAGAIGPVRAFRLLGLWQGPTISVGAAAALFGQPDDQAADALEQLVDAHLLESPGPEIYRFHDLLRVYAAELCQADEDEKTSLGAVRRVLTWYLHTTEAAASIISPHHARVPLEEAEPATRPLGFDSLDQALDWCDSERPNLVAATGLAVASGLRDLAWQLPAAEMSYFYRRSHWADWITTHRLGLESARELGDQLAEAWMLNNLGMGYGEQHMPEDVVCFEKSLAIYREIGDKKGAARVANNLVNAHFLAGNFDQAQAEGQGSLTTQRQAGSRYGEGITLGILGCTFGALGRSAEAVDHLQRALTIFRELGDKDAEADALSDLGDLYLNLRRMDDGITCLRDSLEIRYVIGDRHGQATTLERLGSAWRRDGQLGRARDLLEAALRLFEELADQAEVAEIRRQLGELADVAE